jgi:hypothetical protein
MHLAYAELYIFLAGVFRKYNLHDKYRERDVDTNTDFLVPAPAKGSKGVRVIVRE